MKDGITTLARIEELISTIREQKNGLINDDAVKHWSTIAIHLAATENKDCLNHFVHLGGVIFLSEWLQEAQKQNSDTSDGSLEECICLLLEALKKLSLSNEKALYSGIGFTVKQLFRHGGKNIIEKAKILLTDWAILGDDGVKCQDLKKFDPSCDDGMNRVLETIEAKPFVASSSKEVSGKVNLESEKQVSIHLNDDLRHIVKGMKVSISNENASKAISFVDIDEMSTENVSSLEESSVCLLQGIGCTSVNVDVMPESSQKTSLDGVTEMEIEKGSVAVSCMSDQKEVFIVSSASPGALISVNNIDSEDFAAKESTEVHNCQYKVHESTENISQCQQIDETVESGLSGLSKIKKEHKSETPYFGTDHLEIAPKESCSTHLKERKRAKSRKPSSMFMAKTRTSVYDNKRLDIALEYEDDALEFAVQVAKEAKREVADREQCSSSSHEDSSEDEIMESESEDSEKEKYNESDQSLSAPKSSHANDSNENNARENSNNACDKDLVDEVESPKDVSVIQESVGCDVEMKCIFDLNVEPDLNHDSNLVMAVTCVSARNEASSSALSTLNFEGEQQAATNHLLETVADCETMLPNEGKKFNLFIDLNISEGEDDVHFNQVVKNKLPVLSDLPSRECSVEIISKKSERLNLDLNSFGDDESFSTPPKSHWRPPEIFGHCPQNQIFGSKISSSFSSRQPVMREIDLNDNLFKSSFNDEKSQDTSKLEDPVITIMGSRMTVDRKESKPESTPQAQNHHPFLVNRLGSMESAGIRQSMAYSHTPYAAYGHNEVALGPSALSLSSAAFYSPEMFPYTVDSRHSTAIPQIFGSSPGTQNPLSYRPPFLVSAAGVPPGLNSVGSFQPDFDLNSGPLSLGSGSGTMEMVAPQTAAGSSLPLKRKEPDCERGEPYPFGYKQMTLWH